MPDDDPIDPAAPAARRPRGAAAEPPDSIAARMAELEARLAAESPASAEPEVVAEPEVDADAGAAAAAALHDLADEPAADDPAPVVDVAELQAPADAFAPPAVEESPTLDEPDAQALDAQPDAAEVADTVEAPEDVDALVTEQPALEEAPAEPVAELAVEPGADGSAPVKKAPRKKLVKKAPAPAAADAPTEALAVQGAVAEAPATEPESDDATEGLLPLVPAKVARKAAKKAPAPEKVPAAPAVTPVKAAAKSPAKSPAKAVKAPARPAAAGTAPKPAKSTRRPAVAAAVADAPVEAVPVTAAATTAAAAEPAPAAPGTGAPLEPAPLTPAKGKAPARPRTKDLPAVTPVGPQTVVPRAKGLGLVLAVVVVLLAVAASLFAASVVRNRDQTWEARTTVTLLPPESGSLTAVKNGEKTYLAKIANSSFTAQAALKGRLADGEVRAPIAARPLGDGQVRLTAQASTGEGALALADAAAVTLVDTVTSDQKLAQTDPTERLQARADGRSPSATRTTPSQGDVLLAGLLAGGAVLLVGALALVLRRTRGA